MTYTLDQVCETASRAMVGLLVLCAAPVVVGLFIIGGVVALLQALERPRSPPPIAHHFLIS